MDMNDRVNKLTDEVSRLQLRLRRPEPSHTVWIVALFIGFALGAFYAG